MSEKEYNNELKFSLHQGDVLLCENIFDADQFNPFTRYSIDIREILPRAITKLQKCLSKRSYQTDIEVGREDVTNEEGAQVSYELFQYHQKMINLYPQSYRNELRYIPQSIVQQIEEKTIRGVECKIGLYINNKPIVERVFYVDGFNPVARWSADVVYAMSDITDLIFEKIKKSDVKNMWDDYDLINLRGLSIVEIRCLSPLQREQMLRRLNKTT